MIKFTIFTRAWKSSHAKSYVISKIPKYDEKSNLAKHLNGYKTRMSLLGAFLTVKYRAFYLTLSGETKIWYSQQLLRNIRS